MGAKRKILEYLDYKGISQGVFSRKCGFSDGFLRSGVEFGTDKLKIILDNYTDLNPMWVLDLEQNMLLSQQKSIEAKETIKTIDITSEVVLVLKDHVDSLKKEVEFYKSIIKNETK